MKFLRCTRKNKGEDGTFTYVGNEIVFIKGKAVVKIPFTIDYIDNGLKKTIQVDNYTCDGSSTPLGMWKASTKLAGLVHDIMTREDYIQVKVLSAHKMFRDILKDKRYTWSKYERLRSLKAWSMWLGVFLFGWIFYKKRSITRISEVVDIE